MRSTKILVAAALAFIGATGAGLAQAHDDVQWSVTVGSDMPVYAQPAPAYRRAPIYVAPAPVIAYRGYEQRGYGWGDRDHDGIPKRYDRVDTRRWDRDHDGIPNRYDRYDNRRDWDRDHDGIPNYRDHHDGRR
jgi:hypothetical protein